MEHVLFACSIPRSISGDCEKLSTSEPSSLQQQNSYQFLQPKGVSEMKMTTMARVREVCRGNAVLALVTIGLRLSLGASFLSAIADRFGWWGPPGTDGVAWGDMAHFEAYTHVLVPFATGGLLSTLAWAATVIEIILAVTLIIGWRVVEAALAAAATLFVFGFSMTVSLPQSALSFNVPSAMMAAAALAVLTARLQNSAPVSVDALQSKRTSDAGA